MTEAANVYEIQRQEDRPLTAVDLRAQVNLIQEVMKAVMQNGQHYGKIPGAGDKPTLLKPGAEKIMATFRLSADPQVEDISTGDAIRYRVKCNLISASGVFKGAGIGECSTDEEKYKWRAAVCKEEFAEMPEDRKRIKWKKGYGDNPAHKIEQIRTEPADLANTVLKMAKKRALVDGVLTVTGASDIFTQDIEDMPAELFNRKEAAPDKPPLKEPAKKAEAIAVECVTTPVSNVESKAGTNPKTKKDYVLYGITGEGGTIYKTFDAAFADLARTAQEAGSPVKITFTVGKYGNDIKSLEIAEREPGAEG